MDEIQLRSVEQRLIHFGAKQKDLRPLVDYCDNRIGDAQTRELPELHDEEFVSSWVNYQQQSNAENIVSVLCKPLVQWNFPVEPGISMKQEYQGVTRRFGDVASCALASGLRFEKPASIQLDILQTAGGRIPALTFATRRDFEWALLALTNRNEPKVVPASVGAYLIAGYNNLDRFALYRNKRPGVELADLMHHREQYQDKLILVSPGPYSNVSAETLGLTLPEWLRLSRQIRVHHEATHYWTKRAFSSMNNNLIDEILADYIALKKTVGEFSADWFLGFMGLDRNAQYRTGSRMQYYCSQFAPDSSAFKVLARMVVDAAVNLQRADELLDCGKVREKELYVGAALTAMTLDELAVETGTQQLLSSARTRQQVKEKDSNEHG